MYGASYMYGDVLGDGTGFKPMAMGRCESNRLHSFHSLSRVSSCFLRSASDRFASGVVV